jgi:hypothetical protein
MIEYSMIWYRIGVCGVWMNGWIDDLNELPKTPPHLLALPNRMHACIFND